MNVYVCGLGVCVCGGGGSLCCCKARQTRHYKATTHYTDTICSERDTQVSDVTQQHHSKPVENDHIFKKQPLF